MTMSQQNDEKKLFTKSAFKIATHCPMQAYYYRNPKMYENQSATDDFLKSLAEGGFQVGELAKIYGEVPPENDLEGCFGYDEPLKRTRELFEQENVNIAEAAFRFGDCFVRADVVKKDGHKIELIEVKAKSWDPKIDFVSIAQGGKYKGKQIVNSDIRDYLYDVAFQKWVVENALKTDYPNEPWIVQAYLMMPDKSKMNTIPRLNSLFRIKKSVGSDGEKRAHAEVMPEALEILKKPHERILKPFSVDNDCKLVIEGKTAEQADVLGMSFVSFIEEKAKWFVNNEKHYCLLGSKCFKCPFQLSEKSEEGNQSSCDNEKKSGFEECWREKAKGKIEKYFDNGEPLIKDINGTGLTRSPNTKDDWIRSGIYFIKDITEAVYPRKKDGTETGWTTNRRKWVQIDGVKNGQTDVSILKKELRAEMKEKWKFPLHMIDFETTNSALPYFEGQRPYEQVAFQFSHHIIYEDGRIEHKGQYLETQPGKFPNFKFVRELKEQLGSEGSVFRYASHENSILRAIRQQLNDPKYANQIKKDQVDKDELIEFIDSITHVTDEEKKSGVTYPEKGKGRDMIDLCEIVKRFYWHPIMKGSNSIKQVLPAILNSGTYIQEKYSKPIYGSEIKSCNYTPDNPIALVQKDEKTGEIQNPYKALPQLNEIQNELIKEIAAQGLWSEEELKQYDQSVSDDEMGAEEDTRINNGGLPLVLFRSFQALDPSVEWDNAITAANPSKDALKYNVLRKGLLKYCELDTMSMVLIWEYFNNAVNGLE